MDSSTSLFFGRIGWSLRVNPGDLIGSREKGEKNVVSRWWNQWIWSSERRRHGRVIRETLDAWRPRTPSDPPGTGPGAGETRTPRWVGDEELVTGAVALLWQGASARDLARWLEGPLISKYQSGADPDEIEELAMRLVEVYENEIFSED